jgi:large subunit ribosomal protein L15
VRDGVRLLGKGELKTKLAFELTGASSGAVKIVEAAGGTVKLTPMPRRAPKPEGEGKPKKARKVEAKSAKAASKPATPKKAEAKKPRAKKD